MLKYLWKYTGNLHFLLETPAAKPSKLNFLDFSLKIWTRCIKYIKVSDTLAETVHFFLFKPKYLSGVNIHIGLIRDSAAQQVSASWKAAYSKPV